MKARILLMVAFLYLPKIILAQDVDVLKLELLEVGASQVNNSSQQIINLNF